MNVYQLLDWYAARVKQTDRKTAARDLYNLQYNRTLSMLIPLLFDADGNPIALPSNLPK